MTQPLRIRANDVFSVVVPDGIDPSDERRQPELHRLLDKQAKLWVWAQWANGGAPQDIEFAISEWLITREVWQVDEFLSKHDCAECRAGSERSKAFLRANPGKWVAMANLTYVEVWPA